MTPEELAAAIKRRPFADVAPELIDQVTKIALGHVQSFTPVDTGLLLSSEAAHIAPSGLEGFVSTDVYYAPFQSVEFMQLGADASVADVEALMQKVGVAWLEVIARGG